VNLHNFFIHGPPPPSAQQVAAAIDEYERWAAGGLEPNDIARRMGVTGGTVCVLRRMSLERGA
jgi:hypothetical protein